MSLDEKTPTNVNKLSNGMLWAARDNIEGIIELCQRFKLLSYTKAHAQCLGELKLIKNARSQERVNWYCAGFLNRRIFY